MKKKGKGFLYITLNGLKNLTNIQEQIFEQLYPKLASTPAKLGMALIKSVMKVGFRVDLNGDGKQDVNANVSIPKIPLVELADKFEHSTLVFDDLERCNAPIQETLGYINRFLEQGGKRVVILANEEEILKNRHYSTIKEKVIGQTFHVNSSTSEAIASFTYSLGKENQQKLHLLIPIIRNAFEKAKYNNLRHVKQAVWEFTRFCNLLPDKTFEEKGLLEELTKTFFILAIEVKSGAITPKEFKLFEKSSSYSQKEKDKQEQLRKEEPFSKYRRDRVISVLPIILWEEFFQKGICNKYELEQAIFATNYFPDKQEPHQKIFNFWYLEEDVFNTAFDEVSAALSNIAYQQSDVIMKLVATFLVLEQIGVINTSEKVVNVARNNLEALVENGKFSFSKTEIIRSPGNGLPFELDEKRKTALRELEQFRDDLHNKQQKTRIKKEAEKVVYLLKSDPEKFIHKIRSSRYSSNPLINESIIEQIDTKTLTVNLLLTTPVQQLLMIRELLETARTNLKADIIIHLAIELINELEIMDRKKTLTRARIKYALLPPLQNYISIVTDAPNAFPGDPELEKIAHETGELLDSINSLFDKNV